MSEADTDRCVYCGALALRDHEGRITTWAARPGYSGAGAHEHETIEGEA